MPKTRLKMLFIPTLPVKVEFTAIVRMLSIATNAKQGLGEIRRLGGLSKYSMNLRWPIGGGGDEKCFLELPRADARQLKIFWLCSYVNIYLISIVSQWNPTTIVMVATTPPGKSIIFLGTAADGTDTIHTRLRNISPFGISGAGFYLGQYHHYRKNKDTYCYSPSILPKKCQSHVILTISISILT